MSSSSRNLSNSAHKVQEALEAHGVDLEVVELPDSTRSAAEAAQAIGCRVGQIVKSLIFTGKATGRPLLVLASGVNRVDEKKLGRLVGEMIRKADAAFVRERTGYAIGGVPPLAHKEPMPTFIDEDLLGYDQLWAAAGTPRAVFALTPADLQALTNGQVASVK
ncbi:MAG: YbaK/EbsC family protein [Rhodothermales bacterium]